MQLREYQKQAIEKIFWSKKENLEGNDLIVLPTGSGKSIVIANLAKDINDHILIIQPTKEILEQNHEKLSAYVDKNQIGIYSASMKEKTIKRFTFATIQSIYKKPEEFSHFNFVIIDEAHLVNQKRLSGMFMKFLRKIGNPKVFGFTATPYRLEQYFKRINGGLMETRTIVQLINRNKNGFWKRILFKIDLKDLIDQGYLCPVKYIDKSDIQDVIKDFNNIKSDSELIRKYESGISLKTKEILEVIKYAESISKNVLVFCSSVRKATELSELSEKSAVVTSETKANERERILESFKNGTIKTIFNVGVLTTGFDHPQLDCIVLLRPTSSIGLYYQMLGRGVRIAEGKTHCNVIDMTYALKNIGKVESIRLNKIDGKWELVSEAGRWHNRQLYKLIFTKK